MGSYQLLDVRQEREYEEGHLPGARLVPLDQLADRLDEVSENGPVIVYCRSGNRSMVASSILLNNGKSDVFNMLGGITAWNGEKAVGLPTQGMHLGTAAKTPLDILRMAYAMELSLGGYYSRRAKAMDQPELIGAFKTLAGLEQTHLDLILRRIREIAPAADHEDLQHSPAIILFEGGVDEDGFETLFGTTMDTPLGALETALMFEAQAFDLYIRLARDTGDPAAEALFNSLANEEKKHLKTVGNLLSKHMSNGQ
ncbi:rhodanese-like domain-containing protein [Desulfovibrio sp. JC022]|uniref:rhodanese-like domain-containing protein n=1 Tax=Desulfovibrio sp. JC022 TaxID=2593642 RepID=UPI0013D5C658